MRIEIWQDLTAEGRRGVLARPALANDATLAARVAAIIERVRNEGDAALLDLTHGEGVDVVIDYVSATSTLEAGAKALGRHGRLVTLGGSGDDLHDLVISNATTGDQTVVPVVLRSLIPVDPDAGGTFKGTVIGGNGRGVLDRVLRYGDEWMPNRVGDEEKLLARSVRGGRADDGAAHGLQPAILGIARPAEGNGHA